MRLDDRLTEVLHAGVDGVEPSPDLFDRVHESVAAARARNRWRRRWAARLLVWTGLLAAVPIPFTSIGSKGVTMPWWVLEIVATAVLITLVALLGPFIKRFGRSYAAEVFRSNPGTGKSFIVLTDFAYYLIFGAYVLLTMTVARPHDWAPHVTPEQVRTDIAKVGGLLLLMGVLHGLNLLVLPIIGRLLTLNRRLDHDLRVLGARTSDEARADSQRPPRP